MKAKKKSTAIPFDEIRLKYLRDPKEAQYAVKLALEEYEKDGDVDILLDTFRLVAQAQGGLAKLARKAAVSRQALHEALSPKGNPRLRTFQNVLGGLGWRMTFSPVITRARRTPAIAA